MMKISEIKSRVFDLLGISDTKQIKKKYPQLVRGKDLRYKANWSNLLDELLAVEARVGKITLETLEETDEQLKQSFFDTHRLLGYSEEKIKIEWQRLSLEAQFSDIHIEEL